MTKRFIAYDLRANAARAAAVLEAGRAGARAAVRAAMMGAMVTATPKAVKQFDADTDTVENLRRNRSDRA